MNQDDAVATTLSKITDELERLSKISVNHQKHLERLSSDVAAICNRVKNLETGNATNLSDTKFLASVTERLKAISNSLDANC